MRTGLVLLAIVGVQGCKKEPPSPARDTDPASVCITAYVEAHGLNSFGDPKDTQYAGGNPLFNEATGALTDRTSYVFSRHPEIKTACGMDAGR